MTNLATTIPPDQICNDGEPVFPELRNRLEYYYRERLLDLVNAREAYGVAKYGQTLMSSDGRDTPTEIVNELLDAMAYLTKWAMQNPDQHAINYVLLRTIRLTVDVVDLAKEVQP